MASKHKKKSHNHKHSKSRHEARSPTPPPPLPSFGAVPTFDLKNNTSGPFIPSAAVSSLTNDSPSNSSASKKRGIDDVSEPEDGDDKRSRISPPPPPSQANNDEWTTVTHKSKKFLTHVHKRGKKEVRKDYPEFVISPQKLRGWVKLSDLQNLTLNILADGMAPNWLLVKNRQSIRKVVLLWVPGLSMDLFDGHNKFTESEMEVEDKEEVETTRDKKNRERDEAHFPLALENLPLPEALQPLKEMFTHIFPIRASGDYNKVHSPVQSILQVPLEKEEKDYNPRNKNSNNNNKPPSWKERNSSSQDRLKVTKLLTSFEELVENEYPLHTSHLTPIGPDSGLKSAVETTGWKETDLTKGKIFEDNEGGSILEGRTIYALDCEMVTTASGATLARISIVDWDGTVILDKLVKPSEPITDYLTQFSGITPAMLKDVTTTREDIQAELDSLLTPFTILVGHSLNSDLGAIQFTHPYVIDTSLIYHHPKGRPLKPGLRWLAQKHLNSEIQKDASGHDSIEDARTCLNLLKLKLDKGFEFGTSAASHESIFTKLGKVKPKERTGAVVDYGDPLRRYGTQARRVVGCNTDEQVVDGVISCIEGDMMQGLPPVDFVWGKLAGLEQARRWNTGYQSLSSLIYKSVITATSEAIVIPPPPPAPSPQDLAEATRKIVEGIAKIYNGLPKCTAFIVYSGTGDPIEMGRLNAIQSLYRKEFKVRKWDDCSVKWTSVEEDGLKAAVMTARKATALLTVK